MKCISIRFFLKNLSAFAMHTPLHWLSAYTKQEPCANTKHKPASAPPLIKHNEAPMVLAFYKLAGDDACRVFTSPAQTEPVGQGHGPAAMPQVLPVLLVSVQCHE